MKFRREFLSWRFFKNFGRWRGHLCLALAAASAVVLSTLPGRSSQAIYVETAQAERAPNANGFDLGPLHWEFRDYQEAPALSPLRSYFSAHCGGTTGLVAGTCLSNAFWSAFPQSSPSHEFVDRDYDPAADLAAHVEGEPGHCLTRSGLISAILLASGIPARVVQIVGTVGHTVVEVWDLPSNGWVLIDTSFGASFVSEDGPASAVSAILRPESSRWVDSATLHGDVAPLYKAWRDQRSGTQLAYPDPWLYTRSGHRAARFPLRGAFVHVGPWQFFKGPAQSLFRWTALGFAALGLFFFTLSTARKKSRASAPQFARGSLEAVRKGI